MKEEKKEATISSFHHCLRLSYPKPLLEPLHQSVQLVPLGKPYTGSESKLCKLSNASSPGVQLIMGMLSEKPRSGTPAEAAACERVQQKAAVTLARLCRDPDVAREAVRLSCE